MMTRKKEEEESKLIRFTINGEEYNALPNMTWGEWVSSEYNVNGHFEIYTVDNSIGYNPDAEEGIFEWVGNNENYVYASDIIQEDYDYLLVG